MALRVGYFGAIIAPIFGYAVIEWNKISPDHAITLPAVLFFLFLGSAILAAGHLLNEVLCPPLIKLYGTHREFHKALAEFVLQEDQIFRAGEEAEKRRAISETAAKFPELGDEEVETIAETIIASGSESLQTPKRGELVVSDYWEAWNTENEKWPAVRLLIATCYVVAGLIALALTLRQLWVVFVAAQIV